MCKQRRRRRRNGGGAPEDLTTMTKKQYRDSVNYLAENKTLSQLRRDQDLVNKQITTAFEQRNDKAMANLRVREQALMEAIDKKEFGPKRKK